VKRGSSAADALLGFYMSQRTLNTTALENEYTVYKAFAQLQHDNPLFTYLFSPSPEDYYYTVETSEKLMRGKTSDELKILALQERSLVNYIYTAYEQTYYKWQDTGYFYFINLGFE
jgi:hypothetical protein